MWRHFVALVVAIQTPLLLLSLTVLLSSEAYLIVRYGKVTVDTDAIIEALNFSVQTVTTVGYGNWDTGLSENAPVLRKLKLVSIPTMIFGALFFGFLLAAFANFYAVPRRCPHCARQF